MVEVVTDSCSDIPSQVAQALGITIVPLSVCFGDESFQDGVDIGADEFYARLATAPILPKTMAPSPGAFAETYNRPGYGGMFTNSVYPEASFQSMGHIVRENIFGSELDGTRGDKSELLRFALAESQADSSTSMMVGDRKHDVIGATNNDMPAIGVLYGYGSEGELKQAGARHLADTPQDLVSLLL